MQYHLISVYYRTYW